MKELINTADAANSETFTFAGIDGRPATLFVEGLGTGEIVSLQFTIDNGTTFTDVYVNTAQVKFTPTANTMWLNVRGRYRLSKEATADAVKAVLITENEGV